MIIRELAAIFSFKYDQSKLKQATTALDSFASKANLVMGALAGHFVVQAVNNFVTNVASAMEQMGKSSSNLGITAEALQELKFAAQKSGIEFDKLEDCLKELMLRSVEAKSGSGNAAEGFKALGIATTDAAGRMREPLGLLEEVADKVKNMPTQSDKIWATDKLFGDPGFFMLGLLNKGSEGIRELRTEARHLGIVLDEAAIQKAANFNKALKEMKASTGGLASNISSALMPGLTWLFKGISKISSTISQLNNKTGVLRVAFISLGLALSAMAAKAALAFTPILVANAPMLALVAAITAGFLSLGFVVEDLWIAFKGGDSVFASLYQNALAFFKPVQEWIANLRKSFDKFFGTIKEGFLAIPNLIPDYFKKGLVSTLNFKGTSSQENLSRPQSNFIPSSSSLMHPANNTSNQSVNLAVNVKSDSAPQAIGSEVAKAVRRELERERANAFMGVSQYAG